MSEPAAEPRVLVVGAGPSGLVLASELLRHGIRNTVVISKHKRESPHSKATIIWPRILELLDRIGAAEPLVESGHYIDQMNYYSNKKRIGLIRFDKLTQSAYPFAVTIPQWRTEQLLEENLNRLGGRVHYGVEFAGGSQCSSQVGAQLRGDGAEELPTSYDWVVGADGYGSAVREAFGIRFDGFALPNPLAITDAEVFGEVTSSEAAYYLTNSGNMVIAPIGDGVFRVGASVPEWFTGDVPDRDLFERLLSERVPGRKKLGAMRFSGMFAASVRSADTYQRGRVFLVGDAAHAMSPSGAQAMNTGIQDSVNLGWKLAAVMRGHYSSALLNTYDRERRPAVQSVAKVSTQLAKISMYSKPGQILARDAAYRLCSATNVFGTVLAPKLAQLETHYGATRSRKRWTPGERLPLGWRPTVIEPVLGVDAFTALLWPGTQYHHSTWARAVADIRANLGEAHVIDLAGRPLGALLRKLGDDSEVLLVRPDGHLRAVVPLDHDAAPGTNAHAVRRALPETARPRIPEPTTTSRTPIPHPDGERT